MWLKLKSAEEAEKALENVAAYYSFDDVPYLVMLDGDFTIEELKILIQVLELREAQDARGEKFFTTNFHG